MRWIQSDDSRAGAARSFSRVTSEWPASSHYGDLSVSMRSRRPTRGPLAAFYWDQGLPSYHFLPPQVNPSFSNNGNVDCERTKRDALAWERSAARSRFPASVIGEHGAGG